MSDKLTAQQRSQNMARIRGKDTKPEIAVRSLLHRLGYRFRLHGRHLPGTPDIVFSSRRKVIFVHGCFWHRHPGCKYAYTPRSRSDFWETKFARNTERDIRDQARLATLGWSVLIVWECETREPDCLTQRLVEFLEGKAGLPKVSDIVLTTALPCP